MKILQKFMVLLLILSSLNSQALIDTELDCQIIIEDILLIEPTDLVVDIKIDEVLNCEGEIAKLDIEKKHKLLGTLVDYKENYLEEEEEQDEEDAVYCQDLPELIQYLSYDKSINVVSYFTKEGCLTEFTDKEEEALFEELIFKLTIEVELSKLR